jgi:hypothetical protein
VRYAETPLGAGAETALGGAETALGGAETALGGAETALGGAETGLGGAETGLRGAETGLRGAGICHTELRFPGPWCIPGRVPGPAWGFGQFGGARAGGVGGVGTTYKRN